MGKVEHDKDSCIGCGACVAIHPDGWAMGDDGKATIKGGKERADGWEEKTTTSDDYEQHKEAAESCPVTCIHLKDDDDNQII